MHDPDEYLPILLWYFTNYFIFRSAPLDKSNAVYKKFRPIIFSNCKITLEYFHISPSPPLFSFSLSFSLLSLSLPPRKILFHVPQSSFDEINIDSLKAFSEWLKNGLVIYEICKKNVSFFSRIKSYVFSIPSHFLPPYRETFERVQDLRDCNWTLYLNPFVARQRYTYWWGELDAYTVTRMLS